MRVYYVLLVYTRVCVQTTTILVTRYTRQPCKIFNHTNVYVIYVCMIGY
ncbi:hypothetical protein HMPREF0091_10368 [Fannyhessea vaginae DSM 15829]|uniref:Uncharacterized protein n=1 Tax=Fannyhessea vaginae DSM 15829 TaxID=525256 RepID=F1T3X7_9ACTN|nr:hypothetical protein HMPREF0091_10368 [Fannyhessea vaginae DSM 15829]